MKSYRAATNGARIRIIKEISRLAGLMDMRQLARLYAFARRMVEEEER